MTEPLSPADITADHFRPHIDKDFRIPGWPHPMTLTAVEARRLEEWERNIGLREPFSLVFRGPPGTVIGEGFYTIGLEGGPSFNLHLMPVHTVQSGQQNYQAAFN
ncbi:DUF6916 family protein [Kumtagia ephedrae]|jgi:hypothetical protein|uniref:DUF6916 domain-containing protein n=1 Tax=Kumtagia ephedrae TaxID=2116701 RepID=A0A2P7ST87_9HYPH|nr:hypothetical protein [Mesorhizobium ephedrae]PSJ65702.1 hypothetical protein C7I84_00835 [Mesorhizobium ephedrae]